MFLLGLPMCLGGGVYLFELLNYYSGQLSVLVIAILEVLVVTYVYGEFEAKNDPNFVFNSNILQL